MAATLLWRGASPPLAAARRGGRNRVVAAGSVVALTARGDCPVEKKQAKSTPEAIDWTPFPTSEPMAKPNYSFEKRQRELAQKKKKEEKLAQKQAARDAARPAPPAEPESDSKPE